MALVLSGCATKEAPSTATGTASKTATIGTTSATSTAAPAPAVNATPPPAANHAPTANLTAKAGNGTAALNVTFTLSGADADGDALNWTLSFGDGANRTGSALPANATHAYAKGGPHNVTLTVTDGKNATTVRLRLNLTAGAAAAPILLAGHVALPSVTYNTEGECLEPIFGGIFGLDTTGNFHDVPAAAVGGAYSFDVEGMVAIWYDADLAPTGPEGSEGTVPPGTTQVIACSASAVDTDYVLAIVPA